MDARFLIVPVLLIFFSALGGCTTPGAPQVDVAEAVTVLRTDQAMRVDIGLDLQNRSDQPLDLREARYTLYLEDRPVYRGRWATQVTLSSASERRVTLPAVVRRIYDDSAQWRIEGELVYLVPSRLAEILLDSGWWEPKVFFAGSGRLTEAAPAAD
jgi:hypothetical protein